MTVQVSCRPQGDGYRCEVAVTEGSGWTRHTVRVSAVEMTRWARGRSPEQLVKDAFNFLLERESSRSILREFDLSTIKRYFPEYDG
jgi:hypothetical protein